MLVVDYPFWCSLRDILLNTEARHATSRKEHKCISSFYGLHTYMLLSELVGSETLAIQLLRIFTEHDMGIFASRSKEGIRQIGHNRLGQLPQLRFTFEGSTARDIIQNCHALYIQPAYTVCLLVVVLHICRWSATAGAVCREDIAYRHMLLRCFLRVAAAHHANCARIGMRHVRQSAQ